MNMMQKPSLGGVWERISCKESWIYNLTYFEGLGSRNCKLKYSYIKSLTQLCKQCTGPDLSTPDFSTMNFSTLFNQGVEKFMVEKFMVEKFMVENSGVEKFGVEMAFNLIER